MCKREKQILKASSPKKNIILSSFTHPYVDPKRRRLAKKETFNRRTELFFSIEYKWMGIRGCQAPKEAKEKLSPSLSRMKKNSSELFLETFYLEKLVPNT